MIVNAFKHVCDKETVHYFSRMSRKLVHSTNMCFTVSGNPQNWQVGGLSVNIWRSYGQYCSALFFDSQCRSLKMPNLHVVSYAFSKSKKIAVTCCFWTKASLAKDSKHASVCGPSTFAETTLCRCNYVVSFQVPHESVIHHTFHNLANTAGRSNRTVIRRFWCVFSWFWYWNNIWLTPTRRKVTC